MTTMRTTTAARRDETRVALETWAERRRERLAREPESVRQEMLSVVRERLVRDGRIDWSARDAELCRMRVLSRVRLKRYGAIPLGSEWQRQIEEIRATLGLDPGAAS